MDIVSDEFIELWFDEIWNGGFDWDTNNLEKMSKHSTNREEIESLFSIGILLEGRIVEPPNLSKPWGEFRYLALGRNKKGKGYAIIFTTREQTLRPICCRRMRPNEEKKLPLIGEIK